METKFTPGPWEITDYDDKLRIIGERVPCSQFGELCTPVAFTNMDSDLDKANARLIAAAPEMFKVLSTLETLMTAFPEDFEMKAKNLPASMYAEEMISEAIECLKKVRGE